MYIPMGAFPGSVPQQGVNMMPPMAMMMPAQMAMGPQMAMAPQMAMPSSTTPFNRPLKSNVAVIDSSHLEFPEDQPQKCPGVCS